LCSLIERSFRSISWLHLIFVLGTLTGGVEPRSGPTLRSYIYKEIYKLTAKILLSYVSRYFCFSYNFCKYFLKRILRSMKVEMCGRPPLFHMSPAFSALPEKLAFHGASLFEPSSKLLQQRCEANLNYSTDGGIILLSTSWLLLQIQSH